MPLGGGSGEGGLAARGYNGVAQPGGNYGGTNVVGTGGGYLGDRSAINAAVLAQQNPSTFSGTQSKTYQVFTDPITGKKTKVLINKNGIPVNVQPVNPVVSPAPPFPGDNWQWSPQPGWQPGTGYPGRPDVVGGISNPRPGGSVTGPGGMFGGIDTPGNLGPGSTHQMNQPGKMQDRVGAADSTGAMAAMSMMAEPVAEQPLVSPGPIGPRGQPMGNDFQWGARDLGLIHDLMRRRRMMADRGQRMNPRLQIAGPSGHRGEGRQRQALEVLRALRGGRGRA